MKIKNPKQVIFIMLIAFSSIYLNGCMMAGMGIMHGGGNHNMNNGNHNMGKSIIKEFRNDKYIITAEFPSMARNSSDFCKIKVLNKNSNSLVSDVDAYLIESSGNNAERSEYQDAGSTHKISSSRFEDGYLIFIHDLTASRSYYLTINIKRIENDIFDTPIEIQYQMNNQPELNNDHSHNSAGDISTSTYLYIGAAAMAVMMYFVVR